jgi:plasmid stability protein
MASLTVRNVPEEAKHRFRQVAAAHGRSMEEHLRQLIIDAGMETPAPSQGVTDVNQTFRPFEPADPRAASRARIERLIELGRGLDWTPEPRRPEPLTDFAFDPQDFE